MMDSVFWDKQKNFSVPEQYWLAHPEQHLDSMSRFVLRELTFNRIRKIIQEKAIKTILDLACGFGPYFPLYHDLGCKVTALDYSDSRLEIARQLVSIYKLTGIEIINQNIISADKYGSFDCVMLSYILQHLTADQVNLLINKIKNVAKYYIVIGYYAEPFQPFRGKHEKLCKSLGVAFNQFDLTQGLNSAAYDYPKLFGMEYELYQYPGDVALILFRK